MKAIEEPWKSTVFYERNLKGEYASAYRMIRQGLSIWQEKIVLPIPLESTMLQELVACVCNDHPLYFHTGTGIRYHKEPDSTILFPIYKYTPDEYWPLREKVIRFVEGCRQSLDGKSELYKVRAIHDAIALHVRYDHKEAEGAHDILGTILRRSAVCEGISKCFKLICDSVDVVSIVVEGWSRKETVNKAKPTHAWNAVNIDGDWYNLDVTWDLMRPNIKGAYFPDYQYFCRSDEIMSKNHFPMVVKPACTKDIDIYRASGMYCDSTEKITLLLSQAIESKAERLQLAYADDLRIGNPWEYLKQMDRSDKEQYQLYKMGRKRRIILVKKQQ